MPIQKKLVYTYLKKDILIYLYLTDFIHLYHLHEYKHKENQLANVLGNSNSYFTFSPRLLKKILRDLNRIDDKYLNPAEKRIIDGNNTEIEVAIDKQQQRSVAIKTGMQRAKHCKIHIGRPKGQAESQVQFLAKPKNQAIASVLKKGFSLRQTAKELGVSINTVRKVKAILSHKE